MEDFPLAPELQQMNTDHRPLSVAQANDMRQTNRKMLTTRFGDQIPEPHWSYHKPTTHKLKQAELYGPKLKAYTQSTTKNWSQSSIRPYVVKS